MINANIPGWIRPEELVILSTLAKFVPSNGSILEVGCFLGRSTVALYNGKDLSVSLSVVDTFGGLSGNFNGAGDIDMFNAAKDIAATDGWQAAFKFCIGEDIYNDINVYASTSKEFVKNKTYNLTFIDASHYYEDVRNDLKKFASDTELLVGDDFSFGYPGVSQALNQFRNERTLVVFEDTKLWALIPKTGYWRDIFKNNNLLFVGENT